MIELVETFPETSLQMSTCIRYFMYICNSKKESVLFFNEL